MALAKWARTEEPQPGSLKTRRDVDEWLLPDISRYETLHTVLDLLVYLYKCDLIYIQISLSLF